MFVDHFVCSNRGRKFKGKGISQTKRKANITNKDNLYSGGCTFVDAALGYIDIQFQSHFTSEETTQAVKQHEAKAHDKGIIAQEHQSDNGTAFTSQAFRQHLLDKGQTERFAGAGSHHQNGRAEQGMRTIMSMAQTMMLH